MPPSPDLNLLSGMLALQLAFITKDQLLAAMQLWVDNKSKPLSQILLDQGILTPNRHQLLNVLVRKHLESNGDDARTSIEALNVVPTAIEALLPIQDSELNASLQRIGSRSVTRRDPPDSNVDCNVSIASGNVTESRFRILREHAKGGLGVVFVARDEEIGREVALKEIRANLARDADSRTRFELEAEITGGLEHPGIVPVYGLGHYADGRPYYAMRFIRGNSLKEAADEFHAADRPGRDPTERSLALRQLLRRFIDVCNAMEYAHSKGVLHRDLKPGNIMLGRYGETLVVDWGLAKAQGKADASAGRGESPLTPSSMGSSSQTRMGCAIGTPAFMSPEQAVGRLDLLGPASDIYSLGATLYYVLAGQPSVLEPNLEAVVRCVRNGDFPSPREVNPQVDRPLEAICMKAMAVKPADRYASAADLKADVERWLDDSPVTAWREPWSVRTRRWLNRHRTLTVATAAAFVVAAVGLGIAAALLTMKNNELDAAWKVAKDNEADAKAKERVAKRHAYASALNLAQAIWRENDFKHALEVLNATDENLRGWEYTYLEAAWKRGQKTFPSHAGAVAAVAFTPDGHVISGGKGPNLKIWNVATSQDHFSFKKGHTGEITCVAVSADGKRIVSGLSGGDSDKTLKVWDAANGAELFTLAGHEDRVSSVAISADGRRIVSGSVDKTVKVWDAMTGQEEFTLGGHKNDVRAVAISPDGERIVSSSDDATVQVWDTKTRAVLQLKGHKGAVSSVAFSGDGLRIATGGDDETVRVWDAKNGAELLVLRGHRGDVVSVAFSTDGRHIASGGGDATVRLWDARTGAELRSFKGHVEAVTSVAFSKNGARIVSGSLDKTVKVWDTLDADAFIALGHSGVVTCVAFSSAGRWLVTGLQSGSAKVWDAETGAEKWTLQGHGGPVNCVAFSADGQRIVTGSADKTLKVWNAATGAPLFGLAGHTAAVTALALSPDGERIVSGSADRGVKAERTIVIWDARTGARIRTIQEAGSAITSLSVSSDGKLIISGDESSITVWDMTTGDKVRDLVGHTGFISSVGFSADGQRIVSGGDDHAIKIWDAQTGSVLRSLTGHTGDVNAVAFSPDGERIISASDDETVRLWDATIGRELIALRDLKGPVRGLSVSSDGQSIAGAGDRAAIIWKNK
jgi:WD40 repeat protein/serine/threonine protein kinase